MNVAALTYVYNENINLSIWRRYYGANFGENNLFVVDRQSDDGSTRDLGDVNKFVFPRTGFDDTKKIQTLNSLHSALLQSFDCVIVTDCDEIVVPDPQAYSSLRQYIETNTPEYINCIGLDICHVLTMELPLDLASPILSQRSTACFRSSGCKPLMSSTPTIWLPGGHSCNKPPRFDEHLFVFHLKYMDYSISMQRQVINRGTVWSDNSINSRHGEHHRYDFARFVREGFLDPINVVANNKIEAFDFKQDISTIISRTVEKNGYFHIPMDMAKFVAIPDRFKIML
jgi:hypothetical protein